ncbi:MAG: hypothetical protein WC333_05460 [Dehalococcoidia bacterium]
MSEASPSKSEQIEALLHGKAYELALKYLPRDEAGSPQYRKLFNVTKKEVEKYAKQNYKWSEFACVKTAPGERDGFYAIRVSKGYLVYDQERGIRFDKGLVHSENDVWRLVMDYILLRSGTGFKFK